MTFEGLFGEHGAPVAFHGGIVRREQLNGEHCLEFVSRADTEQSGDGCVAQPACGVLVGISKPKCTNGLIGENIVPMIRLRSAKGF